MLEKLGYRLLDSGDLDLLFNFNSNLKNLEFVPRTPFKSQNEAEELLSKFLKSMSEQTATWWAFYDKDTNQKIGYGGLFGIDKANLRAEIGYGLLQEYWGKGFATSIVGYITNYCFSDLKLHRIYGLVDPENKASLKVLEKNGYINEGVLHDYYYARDKFFNMSVLAKIS